MKPDTDSDWDKFPWQRMVAEYAASGAGGRDIHLEAYFRKKIGEATLPAHLLQFSTDEIEALRAMACRSAVQLDLYDGDFKKVRKASEDLWKWLVISLAEPELDRRRSESLKLLNPQADFEWMVDSPWKVPGEYPHLATGLRRMQSKEPRGRIDYPLIWMEWWEPMSPQDYVWGTGTYPAKVRKFLKGIKAVPVTPAAGSRSARYSIKTNLAVLEEWLAVWERPERRAEVCGHLKEYMDAAKRSRAHDAWMDLPAVEKFLPVNQPSATRHELPFEDEILLLIDRFRDE